MENTKTDTGPAVTEEAPAKIDSIEAAFDASVEPSADTVAKAEEPPARKEEPLIFGKYKSLDEAEKAFKESERKMHEAMQRAAEFEKKAPPPAKEPEFPELSPDELEELRADDPKLYQDYLDARAQLKTQKIISDEVGPFKELEKQIKFEKYHQIQNQTYDQTREFFGKDFDTLEKQRQDPKLVEDVITKSPIGGLIVKMAEQGMKAEAHRLLLQQIEYHNLRTEKTKKAISVRPDPSTTTKTTRQPKKVMTIEDAFDSSLEELSST